MTAYTASVSWKGDGLTLGDIRAETRPIDRTQTLFSEAELQELRQQLLERRQAVVQEVAKLQNEAISAAEQQAIPLDDGQASQVEAWNRTLSRISVDRKLSLLHEIDAAIRRMEQGEYGYDSNTGAPIPLQRLREIPWSR